MKFKIKQRLRRYFKSEILVGALTGILYFLMCNVYFVKNIFCKHHCLTESDVLCSDYKINSTIKTDSEGCLDLSVIIPVYNGKKYIMECLDSIIGQVTDYTYEIIIVDDGSTDGLSNFIKEKGYLDKIVYIAIENSGQGYARNRGLEQAKGKRIMFLDADDKMAEGCIQSMLRYNEDLVQCGFELFGDENSKIVHKKRKLSDIKNILDLQCYLEGYPWGKVYKRELFAERGFPEKIHFEDNNLNYFVLPEVKSYRYEAKPLIYYRIHAAQETANVNKQQIGLEQIHVIIYLFNEAKKKYCDKGIISKHIDKCTIYNLTAALYSRIKGCEHLFDKAFGFFVDFYNKNFITEKPKTFKNKQLKKAVVKKDLTKYINICKYL